jgi:hypothetical protein
VKKVTISEANLRSIIRNEIAIQHLIEEGMWDDVKDGLKKLSSAVSDAFSGVADKWAQTISEKIAALQKLPPEVLDVIEAVKEGMKSSGESIPLDDTLRAAKELSAINPLQAVEADLQGPVHANAKQLSEMYAVLSDKRYIRKSFVINEAGVIGILGIGLAIVGGLPLLFKGLTKLANYLGATKAAEIFEKAEHVTHAFESKVIDYIVPDRLSYVVYSFLAKKGFYVTGDKSLLSYEEYSAKGEPTKARQKTDELIYKAMLIYFAFQGLAGAVKAGASLLGFIEGTATTVKGIELAKGASDVYKIVNTAKSVV